MSGYSRKSNTGNKDCEWIGYEGVIKTQKKKKKKTHSRASSRRKRNRILGLLDEAGTWQEDKLAMEKIVCRHFSSMFNISNPSHNRLGKVLDYEQPKLSASSGRLLDRPFSAEDVRKVLFDMSPTKAPDKDGFPALFY
ncbi:hypothetical protein Dsin_005191 [Dipteronia sinensis]|uniref:Uncharacterized protein n=1 Tax=Dipteronia sinensis TaxID=43782 RepID=A0AAE0AXB8_9ROSI|nr:hypothetical protein Dsin_005191 [Dipteronia sinensis]